MKIGYVGLGKMGKNMVLRLLDKQHQVVAWNRSPGPRQEVASKGAIAVNSLEELVSQLPTPRVIWLMLPAGKPTQDSISTLKRFLEPGDVLINGANEFYQEAQRHAEELATKKIHFVDAGVSGGQDGARNGSTIMIGGEKEVFGRLEPLFKDLAAPEAYQFFEGHGAGHFVKMVHNGIEYGMMQAIAEGFDIMKHSDFNLDLKKVAQVYNQKSIIESRLMGWMLAGFNDYGVDLESISGSAGSGGAAGMSKSEAKWTVEVAESLDLPADNIKSAVEARIKTQNKPSYQGKIINALRNQFGGHSTEKQTND